MTYIRTLTQMELAVQQLGGWENSSDVTPAILLQAVNYGLVRGYDLMVQRWADYFTVDAVFGITAGVDHYTLEAIAPSFYKLRHLDVSADGQRYVRSYPHDLSAASRWSNVTQGDVRRVRYRIQAASLVLVPKPSTGFGRIFYIPQPVQFSGDDPQESISFDVPAEEMLVVHLAQRDILIRSDLDTSSVDRMIAEDTMGLRSAADSRDAGEPFYLDPRGPRREWGWNDDIEEFT